MNYGVINLDKPSGPSSHQVASWVRDIFELEKVGHGGTLDPRVTGVLPITMGHSIKTLRFLAHARKEYISIFRFHRDTSEERIREVIGEFTGPIYQTPPVRSAVKRQLRIREIYYMEILEIERRDVLARVGCQAGTYIRQLAHDLGEALGIGGHMQDLRRTQSGPFNEMDSITLHDVKDAYVYWKEEDNEVPLRNIIHPMEMLFNHIPTVILRDSAVDAICHGAQLAVPGVVKVDKNLKKGDTAAYLTIKGEGIALAKSKMDATDVIESSDGQVGETLRILMDLGTYPKGWKTEKA
jgi:H/ACA ribonucleoprotein complex subunit 4